MRSSVVLALVLLFSFVVAQEPCYDYSEGGANWVDQCGTDAALCGSGTSQSPINIDSKKVKETTVGEIKFEYGDIGPEEFEVVGYTVEIPTENVENHKLRRISGGDLPTSYILKQLHFHAKSEHTINGHAYELGIHFVHVDEETETNLAVLGVLVTEGAKSQFLASLGDAPLDEEHPEEIGDVNLGQFLNELIDRSYYYYPGSLTTPNCNEGVMWHVFKTPITASRAQIDSFVQALNYPEGNDREVQPLNSRTVNYYDALGANGGSSSSKTSNNNNGSSDSSLLSFSVFLFAFAAFIALF